MQLNNYLIIIPARKNSKRIIGKNLRELNGKPLISYSIEYALKHDINPKNIWVNTDDDRIINLAKAYNISSYKRPDILALDETSTNDVLINFLDFTIKNNIDYTHIITLQPTNPIRSEDLLIRSAEVLENSKRESLMSVSLLNKKFGKIKNEKYIPQNYEIGQRHQDLEHLYYENGLIYISKRDALFIEREYITKDVYPYLTNDIGSDIDIDYESDLELAEIILKK
jgi:N-acylneuraminate cytidylyltransferase